MKHLVGLLATLLLNPVALAQNLGDHHTAGHTNARTSLNSDAGDFRPPLKMTDTIPLTGITSASTMLVFENYLLVGEGGTQARYRLFNRASKATVWTKTFGGPSTEDLSYIPAFANDVVLLGSAATSTVRAVRVSTGTDLWEDSSVGSALGRHPILTDDLAIYHGQLKVVARSASNPDVIFWQKSTTTARAPLALFGRHVYLLQSGGALQALSLLNGPEPETLWTATGVGSNGSTLIATENFVFINDPSAGSYRAIDAHTGVTLWTTTGISSFAGPALAQAYGHLYVFFSDGDGVATIRAVNPATGATVWEVKDPAEPGLIGGPQQMGPPQFAQVANNALYFYNPASGRIRVVDAFSGTLLWSIVQTGVRGLSVTARSLFVLRAAQVDVYQRSDEVYFAHLADGQGQTTLITLNNLTSEVAEGEVRLFDGDGQPLTVLVEGFPAVVRSVIPFTIAANASVRIQTLGGTTLKAGWARVTSNRPIAGSSIFQFGEGGDIFFEAGVGDARATGKASVFVSRTGMPADPGRQFSTGFALGNPSGETATVTLRLRNNTAGAVLGTVTLTLPANGHIARFIQEVFPDLAPLGFEGTLEVESSVPLVVTALRTQGGFQMSSYPVGQRVR